MGYLRITAFFLLLAAFGLGNAISDINNCQALSVAGETYNLTQNVTNTTTCFTVSAQNVTLDCNGFSITGTNASNSYGVYSNQFNTTIRNCQISNFSTAIYFNGATNGNITNTSASTTRSSSYGIYLYNGANYNTLSNLTATSTDSYGIYLQSSSNNTLSNLTATSTNSDGIYLSSSNNTLSNLTATSTHSYGIHLQSSSNNTLTNLTAASTNSDGIYLSSSSNNTLTNLTATSTNRDDISSYAFSASECANTFTNVTGTGGKPILYYTNSPASISGVDASAIILCNASNSNVSNSNATKGGIQIYFSNSATLSNLTATSTNSHAIYLSSSSNNTLSNLTATSTDSNAIFLSSSSNNTLSNLTAASTHSTAITLYSSSNNTLSNLTATASSYCISLSSSSNNTLTNLTATSGSYCIYLSSSSNNTLSNLTATSTSGTAIFLYSSSNNTFYENYISTNSTSLFAISVNSQSSNNTFYNNTINSTKWVSNANAASRFNTTIDGRGIGNKYYFFNGTPSWSIFNLTDYEGNYFADAGTSRPFNASTVGANWSGVGADYHPYTSNYISCPNITESNVRIKLISNLSNSSTCFTVQAANFSLDCNGFSIAGNSASNTYGIYSNATNTTVKNCIISNFQHAIYYNGASNGIITNASARTAHFNGYGIYLKNGAANNSLSNFTAFSQDLYALFLSSAPNNNLSDFTANSTGHNGLYLDSSSNNNLLSNFTAFGTWAGGVAIESSHNNSLSNFTAIGNEGDALQITGGQNNTLFNFTATSPGYDAIQIYGSSTNNTMFNFTATSSTSCAIYLYNAISNGLSNSAASSSSGNAICVRSSTGNLLSNLTANSSSGNAIYLYSSSNNNTFSSVAATSSTTYAFNLSSGANNTFTKNNISGSGWVYSSQANFFNTTVAGKAQGNYYPNASAYGAYDLDGDGFSDTNVTFNNTLLSSLWLGIGSDFAPAAPLNLPPSATFTISPEYAYPSSTVACTLTATDDYFSSLNATYSLYKNGAAIQNGSQNITSATELASSPSNSAGDTIYCTATVSDPYNSTTITSTTRSVQALQPSGGQGSSGTTPPPTAPPTTTPPATPPQTPLPIPPPVEIPSTPEQLSITVPAQIPAQSPAEAFITTYSGDPLYNAKVTITTPSGKIITTMTDANGKVQFFTDEPGKYTIESDGAEASTIATSPAKEPTTKEVVEAITNPAESAAKPENAPAITYSIAFAVFVVALFAAAGAYILFFRKR